MKMIQCRDIYGRLKAVSSHELQFRISVYAIIMLEQSLLLGKMKTNKMYCLPGGVKNTGETNEQALIREVREETGLIVTESEFFLFIEDYFYYNPLKKAYHGHLFYYRCQCDSMTIPHAYRPDDDEFCDIQWLTNNEINPSLLDNNLKRIVPMVFQDKNW